MPPALDLTGKRFGRLVVVRRAEAQGRRTAWIAACDCGRVTSAQTTKLRLGLRKSCGCEQQRAKRLTPAERVSRRKQRYLRDRTSVLARQRVYAEHNRLKIRERAARWAKMNPERYQARQRKLHRQYVEFLEGPYLRSMLAQQVGSRASDIPDALVSLLRVHIQIKREIKEQKK